MSQSDHSGLVSRAAEGDRRAFAELYRVYLPLVLRWCLRKTGDRELAADLSSEVFAQALIRCDRYSAAKGSVGSWLLGIAANKLRESRRRERVEDSARRRLGLEPAVFTDADLELVDELVGMNDRLQEILQSLPASQHDALVERVVEEGSYEEIADRLECSSSMIRQRVSRGLRTLRSDLEER